LLSITSNQLIYFLGLSEIITYKNATFESMSLPNSTFTALLLHLGYGDGVRQSRSEVEAFIGREGRLPRLMQHHAQPRPGRQQRQVARRVQVQRQAQAALVESLSKEMRIYFAKFSSFCYDAITNVPARVC
jgi:hypothetical protein